MIISKSSQSVIWIAKFCLKSKIYQMLEYFQTTTSLNFYKNNMTGTWKHWKIWFFKSFLLNDIILKYFYWTKKFRRWAEIWEGDMVKVSWKSWRGAVRDGWDQNKLCIWMKFLKNILRKIIDIHQILDMGRSWSFQSVFRTVRSKSCL